MRLETVKIHRNEIATPNFYFKYHTKLFRDFYMIRMYKNMGKKWKKRKNINSVMRNRRKFHSKISTKL